MSNRSIKQLWCHQVKAARGCAICGGVDQLVFHHIKPRPKATEKFKWTTTPARIEAELNACAVLCQSCHAHGHGLRSTDQFPTLVPIILTPSEGEALRRMRQQQRRKRVKPSRWTTDTHPFLWTKDVEPA